MAFRNIIIENSAKISVKNGQLKVLTERENSVPIEDISAILIESRQSTITTAALGELGQRGCAVFFCDEKHLPCAVLEPFSSHSRQSSVIKKQLHAGAPLKKRLWQSIVVSKIENQAACLQINGLEYKGLSEMAKSVKSGDTENAEAAAAKRYFPLLFGAGFTRSEENGTNAALNYGYAIIRGYMARCLCVYGFIPAIGINHKSELNRFNLADDMMEPFRPFIDLLVSSVLNDGEELDRERKQLLFNCLNLEARIDKSRYSLSYAMEKTVQSLVRSLDENKPMLTLPRLCELKQHTYE